MKITSSATTAACTAAATLLTATTTSTTSVAEAFSVSPSDNNRGRSLQAQPAIGKSKFLPFPQRRDEPQVNTSSTTADTDDQLVQNVAADIISAIKIGGGQQNQQVQQEPSIIFPSVGNIDGETLKLWSKLSPKV